MVILGSRNINSLNDSTNKMAQIFRAYLVTILKALEVCCVLVTNHRNVSENLNNFVKASGSVGEKKEDSGPAADCREESVFTAKLEI
jgi:hypothetical protein